jgi:hypothetical protein
LPYVRSRPAWTHCDARLSAPSPRARTPHRRDATKLERQPITALSRRLPQGRRPLEVAHNARTESRPDPAPERRAGGGYPWPRRSSPGAIPRRAWPVFEVVGLEGPRKSPGALGRQGWIDHHTWALDGLARRIVEFFNGGGFTSGSASAVRVVGGPFSFPAVGGRKE